MKQTLRWLALLSCTVVPHIAAAQTPERPALVDTCQACHGPAGISLAADIPNLAGQKKDYIVKQLEAFKAKKRSNDLMAAIAAQLSAEQIRALASYWSALPAGGSASAQADTAVRSSMVLPADFPQGFKVYQTVNDSATGPVVQRWANEAALKAAKAGQPLPDGSMIVNVNHAPLLDDAQKPVLDAQGRPQPGKVTAFVAMQSRSGWGAQVPALLRNANWDYAVFNAERQRRDTVNIAPCLACHQPLAGTSHVFTLKDIAAAASAY